MSYCRLLVVVHFSALLLASPEVKFTLDDATHDPIDLEAKQLRFVCVVSVMFVVFNNL